MISCSHLHGNINQFWSVCLLACIICLNRIHSNIGSGGASIYIYNQLLFKFMIMVIWHLWYYSKRMHKRFNYHSFRIWWQPFLHLFGGLSVYANNIPQEVTGFSKLWTGLSHDPRCWPLVVQIHGSFCIIGFSMIHMNWSQQSSMQLFVNHFTSYTFESMFLPRVLKTLCWVPFGNSRFSAQKGHWAIGL